MRAAQGAGRVAMDLDETALNIVVDGSSYSTPRRGGVGIRLIWVNDEGHEVVHDEDPMVSLTGATNNQMELLAPIQAIALVAGRRSPVDLARFSRIVIHTDSRYLADNFSSAKFQWPRTRWKTRDGRPVLNAVQWKHLTKECERLYRDHRIRVDVRWVPGKSDEHTKRVDKLAKKAAKSPVRRDFEPQRVRRKLSPRSFEAGCVKMRGQEETIRIVTDKYLKPQRVYHYMFEVVDPQSDDFECVDKVFSALMMSAGHTYRVRFNDEPRNPQVVEVVEELSPSPPHGGEQGDASGEARDSDG